MPGVPARVLSVHSTRPPQPEFLLPRSEEKPETVEEEDRAAEATEDQETSMS